MNLKRVLISLLIFTFVILLLDWALQDIPIAQIFATLSQLQLNEIVLLAILNAFILLIFSLRWWLILRHQGYRISYLSISLYRLASFGLSYFTPGPHFGGEPLQVFLINKRHDIGVEEASSSVALDKLIELVGNFSFLIIGSGVLLASQPGALEDLRINPGISMILFVLPIIYSISLILGRSPISALFPASSRFKGRVKNIEKATARLMRKKPGLLLQGMLASLLVWLALIWEYQLALSFLGLQLELSSVITIMVIARFAMLAPTPGALGTLEAGLVFAMGLLGLESAFGIALALLIRARDIFFGSLGLIYAASLGALKGRSKRGAW